jgi:ubiquinone biosynthesis monooxygenase Coq7
MMRVNHTGEVCAQALYSGQALMARDPKTRALLRHAALEERDHLSWCDVRLRDLNDRASVLNPLWYASSFALGVASGAAGDRWSMAFLAETERQVEAHLDGHLQRIPAKDSQTAAILLQMRADEHQHAVAGEAHGAARMPEPIKAAMRVVSKVMTTTAQRI